MIKYHKRTRKPMPENIVQAWESYFQRRDDESKEILIEHYQPLVRSIMRPFWVKKPFLLDTEDLRQAGNIGLIQAIERYKSGSDASFETFAQLRINGSIIDEINSLDWTPRNTRRQIREVLEAENKLSTRGVKPTMEALSDETGLTPDQVRIAKSSSHRTFILPVDRDTIRDIETDSKTAFGGHSGHFDGNYADSEGLDFRIAIMQLLNSEERQVIYLKFFCGESMINISRILGTSPTRVTMIHKRALEKLKQSWHHLSSHSDSD